MESRHWAQLQKGPNKEEEEETEKDKKKEEEEFGSEEGQGDSEIQK